MAEVGRVEAVLGADAAPFQRGIEEAQRQLQRLGQTTQQASQSVDRHFQTIGRSADTLHRSFNRLIGVAAAFGVTLSAGALVRGAIQTAASFEQLDTQLRFVLGSMQRFQEARQFILRFTAETPLQLAEVTKGFIDLARRGLDTERTLRGVADAASLQLDPAQAFRGMIFALGQIADRGKLAQQELNQLANVGVPMARVREELRALGISVTEDIGSANIEARRGIEAILQVLEKDFGGAMAATASNWTILTSNLRDTWDRFQDTIVRGPLLDFLKSVTDLLREEMQRAVEENGEAFARFGVRATSAIENTALALAGLVDFLTILGRPVEQAGSIFGRVFSRIGELAGTVVNQLLEIQRATLEAFGIDPKRFDAIIATFKGLADLGGPLGLTVKSIEDLNREAGQTLTPATDAMLKTLEAIRKRSEELARARDEALAKAQGIRPSEGVPVDETPALKATAARLRVEEQLIQESLKRQELLVEASFAERARLIEDAFIEDLAREPQRQEELARVREQALTSLAVEEARLLEAIRLDANARQLAVTIRHLQAEIAAHAGKPEEIAKFEAQITQAKAEAETRRLQIVSEAARAELDASKAVRDQRIKDLQELAQAQAAAPEFRIATLQAQIDLLQAQADAETQFREAAHQRIVPLIRSQQDEIFRLRRQQIEDQAALEIAAAQGNAEKILQIEANKHEQLLRLSIEQQTEQQRLLNRQLDDHRRSWDLFANDLERILAPALRDMFTNTARLWERMLDTMADLFFRFAARIATRTIIIPIATQFLGGIGAALGPNATAALADALGIPFQLFQGTGSLGVIGQIGALAARSFRFLGDIVLAGAQEISRIINSLVFPSVENIGTSIATVGEALQLFGGIAGIGGGIFSALTAQTREGMAFGAAGAAGGLAATLATLGFLPAVLGPIGIALAGLLPILGGLFRPRGPGAFLGTPFLAPGAGITVEAGQLAFTGALDVSARGRGGVDVGAIRTTLLDSLTQAMRSVLDLINAVAVDPSALHGVTQQALEQTLNDIIRLNSANRHRLVQEISDQTFLAQTQMIAGLLGPVGDALAQVTALPIEQQIARLPEATQGLVALLQGLEQAFAKLSESANSDVQRRLPQLRDQINAFHARIVSLTIDSIQRAFAEEAAAGIQLAAALPQAVAALDPFLQQISALSQVAQPLLTQLQADVRAGLPPAQAAEDLTAQIEELLLQLDVQQGVQAIATATQIRGLALELRQLGEETNNLLLQLQAQTTLEQLIPIVESQVQFLIDEEEAMRRQTEALEAIRQVFEQPVPVVIVPEGQQVGGMVGRQQGGLIPALLEPGELVFPGPLSTQALGALATVNRTFPRFQVGGFGSGDIVPALLPQGSYVLNRQAAQAVTQLQGGGAVVGGGGGPVPPMVVNLSISGNTFRSREDIRELVQGIEGLLRRQGHSLYRRR
ncbi:MAG TPA: tape measure protein [Alphaproteobacteria bacterium]|nr:tape measure protein [Alphaproteobacteria bacterium]